MPVGQDRTYEEAVALWRAMTDEPPPPGDARDVLDAALRLSQPMGYDRFANSRLNDPALTWAVYRCSPSRLA